MSERWATQRVEGKGAPCPDIHGVASHHGQVERVPRPNAGLHVIAAELEQKLAGFLPVRLPPGRDWQGTERTGSVNYDAAYRWVGGSNGGRSQV